MAVCDYLIAKDIRNNCELVAGIESEGVIINRADIDFSASAHDTTNKNIIKSIVLKSGKKGFKIVVGSNQAFNNTQTTLAVGTNRNTFVNDLAFTIIDNTPELSESVLDALANGQFVVVFENKQKVEAEKSIFQVMGWAQGLRAQTLENNKYNEETSGGWAVMLQETNVPKSAMFFFDTTEATTRAAFNSLTTTI